ncbi:CAP domain-containing protein [Paracoccus methylarcula]|nr:CAP domain-containing protein [Paracoccus methylarcula]
MKFRPVFILTLCMTALTACQPNEGVLSRITERFPAARTGQEMPAAICAGDPALGQRMTEAINAAREGEGKTLLDPDTTLSGVAQSHACDIAATGRASVAGSDGSNVVDRARAAGHPACGVTQLVSVGGTPEGIVGGWMASAAHRDELLAQLNRQIGVGVARDNAGRPWWSVVIDKDCR